MSFDIHADLLAAQKKTAYEPSLLLTIEDNGLPHPRLRFTLQGQGNEPTAAAVIPGEVIIRARHNTGVGVELQRVTDPESQSQWEAWTLLRAGAGYPALLAAGPYNSYDLILLWQDLSTNTVYWQGSADAGQSWGSATALFTPAFALNHLQAGCSDYAVEEQSFSAGTFFYASGTRVYWRYYSEFFGGWSDEFSIDFEATVLGLGAAFTGSEYIIIPALKDYAATADRSLVVAAVPFDEADPVITRYFDLHGASGAAYDLRWPGAAVANERVWLSFSLAGDTAAGAYFNSTQTVASAPLVLSSDFSSPLWLNKNQADRLAWLDWGGGRVYGATYGYVWTSAPVESVTAATPQIISYTIAGGNDSQLSISLDNAHGDFDGIEADRLGATLRLERGALIGGTPRRVTREPFTVEAVDWSADNQRVTITAFNTYGLLARWRAEYAYRRGGQALWRVVKDIVRLCGAGDAIFDASGVFAQIVPEFTIQSGQSALEALQVLQNQYQFWFRPFNALYGGWKIIGIQFFTLTATPTATYAFGRGSGQHPTFYPEDRSSRRLPSHTHALVLADGVGGEAIDLEIQAETGRQMTRFIRRKYISEAASAGGVAASSIAGAQQGMSLARVVCLPAFQLQPFDVVAADGWETGQVRYVSAIREIYDTQKYQYARFRMPYYQEIDLGGVDLFFKGYGSAGFAFDSLPSASSGDGAAREIRRATLVSFNAAMYRAVIQIEGSPAAGEYPVGRWVAAALLTAGATVAVILFDESNPNDGVVLGPY